MASSLAAASRLTINSSQVKFTGVTLGNGTYGKVSEVEYFGKLCAGNEVHSLPLQLASPKEAAKIKDEFLRECDVWSGMRHPNIVSFLGVYYPSSDESGLPVMVTEKMQESLTSLVEKHDDIPLLTKLSILHDVSLGLRYLHDHQPPIIHGELSPNNILVTPHFEAKITEICVPQAITGNNKLIMTAFMPPEAFDDKPMYGPPLDVFSVGGVILYITIRQWPTPKSWLQIDPSTGKRIFLSEVERRQQYIDMMTENDANVKALTVSCLEDDPKLRPPTVDLSERIKMMKEECSKNTSLDGTKSSSWLAEVKQPPPQLEDKVVSNESTIPNLLSGSVKIQWKNGTSAPVGLLGLTAVLYDGAIYVGGGANEDEDDDIAFRVDIFHPDADKWGTAIETPHQIFSLTVLDGKLLIAGGKTRSDLVTNKVLVLESGQWEGYTKMLAARFNSVAVSHQSMMIVTGGLDVDEQILHTTELLDGTTGQWFKCDDIPSKFETPQSAIVGNTLYVFGGDIEAEVHATPLDTLSSHQLKWQRVVDPPYGGSAAVGVNNKYLLAVGGAIALDNDDAFSNKIFTLDSTTNTWVLTGTTPQGIASPAVVCDDNSRLVIIGGMVMDGESEDDVHWSSKVFIGSFQ